MYGFYNNSVYNCFLKLQQYKSTRYVFCGASSQIPQSTDRHIAHSYSLPLTPRQILLVKLLKKKKSWNQLFFTTEKKYLV